MPRQRFAKQVAFITGASSGIGEALAREFAREGASLILLARRKKRLENLREELAGKGSKIWVCPGDVTRDEDLERAVRKGSKRFGGIDIVVANAGFGVIGRLEDLDLSDYRRQFETNVFGVLRTIYATLPSLKKSKGRLVLIGSVSGHISSPMASPYTMSKFAVHALAESLYAELAPSGVSVTLISPGFVASEIHRVDNRGVYHPNGRNPIPKWLEMSSQKAAQEIADAIYRRERERIVTLHGKFFVGLKRFFPGLTSGFLKKMSQKMKDFRPKK